MSVIPPAVPQDMSTSIPNETIDKPEEVYEKTESIASSCDNSETHQKHTDESSKHAGNDETLARTVSAAPSEPEYPTGSKVAVVMVAILSAVFLMALDRTIIATAIPQITNDFNSLDDIGWYGSAFMLTASCFQIPLGKIYTFYSPKWVFLSLITVFEIGSAVCGAAPNSVAFIIGRAIAGVGSAGIMSGAIILMVSVVPLAKRPMYQGFFGAAFGVSSVIGPLLGGVFTTNVSWRWCFYINLPIGGLAMLIIVLILPQTEPAQPGLSSRQQLSQLDLLGELFLLPSVICLLLALQWGGTTYAWGNGRIIALFVVFGLTLIAFVLVQIFKPKTATIPGRIISNPSIISGMFFVFCLASTMMAMVYYLPIWFQAVKGTSAVKSGIDTLPMVIALVVGSIAAGQTVGRIGYYTPLAIASSVLMPIAAGLITTFTVSTSSGYWIGYQILLGFAIGIGMQQGAMAAQTVLARRDVPTGVSLMFFMQQLGGAIFVSVGQNVYTSALVKGLVGLVQGLDPMTVVNTGATDIHKLVPAQDLGKVLGVYNHALRQVFVVGTIMACLSAFGAFTLQWRSVKGKQGPSKQNDSKAKTAQHTEEEV